MSFLTKINDASAAFQLAITNKLADGLELTDREIDAYELKDEDTTVLSHLNRVLNGEHVPGFSVKDFLASPQAKVLIPKIVIGAAKVAAEPIYLASTMFKKIRLKNGSAIQFPQFGIS